MYHFLLGRFVLSCLFFGFMCASAEASPPPNDNYAGPMSWQEIARNAVKDSDSIFVAKVISVRSSGVDSDEGVACLQVIELVRGRPVKCVSYLVNLEASGFILSGIYGEAGRLPRGGVIDTSGYFGANTKPFLGRRVLFFVRGRELLFSWALEGEYTDPKKFYSLISIKKSK